MAREVARESESPEGGAAGERWRASITLATAGLGFVSAGGAWALEQLKGNPDGFERFGLPLIALFALGVAFSHRTRHGLHFQLGLLFASVAVLLERIHTSLHEDLPAAERFMNAYEVIGWFPLVYLFCFAMFEARHALA
ncbi:MAG: hypothetical protein ABFS41_04500, partial [Myxococcota bacterium]